jgi:hypothetical protein
VLTDEGHRFFVDACAVEAGDARQFTQASGKAWGKSYQFRPMKDACTAAKITPAVSFHILILRHTYASRLAMRNVPMAVIAQQLGHADTRMTEKHYAHLAPSYELCVGVRARRVPQHGHRPRMQRALDHDQAVKCYRVVPSFRVAIPIRAGSLQTGYLGTQSPGSTVTVG